VCSHECREILTRDRQIKTASLEMLGDAEPSDRRLFTLLPMLYSVWISAPLRNDSRVTPMSSLCFEKPSAHWARARGADLSRESAVKDLLHRKRRWISRHYTFDIFTWVCRLRLRVNQIVAAMHRRISSSCGQWFHWNVTLNTLIIYDGNDDKTQSRKKVNIWSGLHIAAKQENSI
jgi:hypothetical protein